MALNRFKKKKKSWGGQERGGNPLSGNGNRDAQEQCEWHQKRGGAFERFGWRKSHG